MSMRIKRYLPLLLPIVSVIIIVAILLSVRGMSSKGTLKLATVYGDESALDGITISGRYSDNTHGERFVIKDKSISRTFEYYLSSSDAFKDVPLNYGRESVVLGDYVYRGQIGYVPTDEKDYRITNSRKSSPSKDNEGYVRVADTKTIYTKSLSPYIMIYRNKRDNLSPYKQFGSKSGVAITDKDGGYLKTSRTEEIEVDEAHKDNVTFGSPEPSSAELTSFVYEGRSTPKGTYLCGIGDDIYYTYPTDGTETGVNGIYKITKMVDWFDSQSSTQGESVPIIEFDTAGIKVIGLYSVADRFVLLTVDNDIFTIICYNKDGVLLQKLPIPELDANYIGEDNYTVYTDKDGLSLLYSSKEASYTILSIAVGDRLQLTNLITTDLVGKDNNLIPMYLSRVDDKVLLSANYAVANNTDQYNQSITYKDMIYIFDKTKLIYSGEIVTNKEQDTYQQSISPYTYSPTRYVSEISVSTE